jgi:arylsulfatase A-like enzyme
MIPSMVPGTGAAWLGASYNPFETRLDPARPGPFKLRSFTLADGLTEERIEQRSKLRSRIDRLPAVDQTAAVDEFQRQAIQIVTGGDAQQAFALDEEPQSVRERYGFMPAFDPHDPQRCGAPNWAQRMLLARRLVEAGVRIVTVDLRWWDFHKQGFDSQRRGFLPRFDQAYSALIDDLDERGLLASTLVVAWGEIGRTPRVNADAGRDHWPYVFSAAFAGGGVRGGQVVGSSDKDGAQPHDNSKLPHDVLATIYAHLGVDTQAKYADSSGRPHVVLPEGSRIDELFA